MGGGPQNVDELVIFGIVCAIGLVLGIVVKIFVIDRGRGSAKWLPGQHYEIKPPDSQTMAARPRQKYVDPLAKLNPIYVAASIGGFMLVVFLFYFITKGSLLMGN